MLLPSHTVAQQTSSMVISEEGDYVSPRCPMNWRLSTGRSQAFYPAEILNLPKGTLIHSISFTYNTAETQSLGSGGDIKISLGEVSSISQNDKVFIEEGLQLVYSGAHRMELTSYAEKEVSYTFSTPYEYNGGILVIEVSNMDSPRNLSENVNIWFRWNQYLKMHIPS